MGNRTGKVSRSKIQNAFSCSDTGRSRVDLCDAPTPNGFLKVLQRSTGYRRQHVSLENHGAIGV
jgi:hypothetical protein